MKKEIIVANNIDNIYDEINALIREKKTDVKKVVNDAIISLNWGIGKRLSAEFTGDNKPEYGKKVGVLHEHHRRRAVHPHRPEGYRA